MKNAFLVMICSLICYNLSGQCPPNEVSTNPVNPFNSEVDSTIQDSPHLNHFDWQMENYNPAGYVRPIVNSPFEEDENAFYYDRISTNLHIKDYYVEDGWELLNENITKTSATDIIYFTLYNKYSSTIRILFAMDESAYIFQSVSVELKLGNGDIIANTNTNANAIFHPMGNIGQALDKASTEAVIVSVPRVSNDFYFMVADFPVEYDPCVCFRSDLNGITASFELVEEETINWLGALSMDNSIVSLTRDAGSSNNGKFLFAARSSVNDDITKGALTFRSIDDLMNEYEDFEATTVNYDKKIEKIQKAKTALSVIARANTVTSTGSNSFVATSTLEAGEAAAELTNNNKATFKAFKATADIAKGLSPLTSFFTYQGKAEKNDNQTINKFGNASINFGTLNLDRTIRVRQKQSTGYLMAIPGGLGTTPHILSSIYPKYDNVLGRIAVLQTPEVKIGNDDVEIINGKRLYTKRIAFDATTFEYLFNPAAGVSEAETVIFAALEIVGFKPNDLSLSKDKIYNINSDNIIETEESVMFTSEFVPLSCLSDLGMELAYSGNVIISDASDITITAVNIKLVISYTFNQIGRSGTKNRAVQIITYPTKITETPFEEIQVPISNNNKPIPTVLELNTNQHFTTNTTIFAWEKIVISANLTTAEDVNVKIIAPEIIVENVTIDSSILLQQDFYPNSCSPLEPVSETKISDFCNSSAYKANKIKNPNTDTDDGVIISDKPTTPIAFQAYPNPFTNTFNIIFELETEEETSLVIYDALGRIVETVLMNDVLPLGKYQYEINGERLEGGLYYATLKHSSGTQTIKLLKQ